MPVLLIIGAVGFLFGGFYGAAVAIVGGFILLVVIAALSD